MIGAWHGALQLKGKLSGNGLDAEAQGTAEPWSQGSWAQEPKAALTLSVHHVNLTPLFGLKPSNALAQDASLSSRLSLAGRKLILDDIDGSLAGSRLRGHLAVNFGDDRSVGRRSLVSTRSISRRSSGLRSAARDVTPPIHLPWIAE